jgi:hypothetical protein
MRPDMNDNITVEILRPLRWEGETRTAGATLKVNAFEAQQLLDSGRARLVHADDLVQCHAAARADVLRQLKAAGGSRIGPAPDPWQRLN